MKKKRMGDYIGYQAGVRLVTICPLFGAHAGGFRFYVDRLLFLRGFYFCLGVFTSLFLGVLARFW